MRFAEYKRMMKREEKMLEYLSPDMCDTDKTLISRFNSYKHREITITSSPLSCIIGIDTIEIGGYPYPYLLCKQSKSKRVITINLIEKIAYKRFDSQEMILIIKGKYMEQSDIDVTIRCYN